MIKYETCELRFGEVVDVDCGREVEVTVGEVSVGRDVNCVMYAVVEAVRLRTGPSYCNGIKCAFQSHLE